MSKPRIYVGENIFTFTTEQAWVREAARMFQQFGVHHDDVICIDRLGRICTIGKHFMQATKDDAYPIKVFDLRPVKETA